MRWSVLVFLAACANEEARDWAEDHDGDGWNEDDDCDDADAAISPEADEICDGIDNDCDEQIDGDDPDVTDPKTWYRDQDGDGYGIPEETREQCSQPDGHADNADDCDDKDAKANPGVEWYQDADGDGEGNLQAALAACEQPAGYVTSDEDCDDTDVAVNTAGIEVCNGVDDNCDTRIDDADPTLTDAAWYLDGDGDGYGTDDTETMACEMPDVDYVELGGDCDDADATRSPGAAEICNDIDDDCDDLRDGSDDSLSGGSSWYLDRDNDGYGDPAEGDLACNQPRDRIADGTDCDDGSSAIHPGAGESCNEVDDDCDALVDEDDPELTGATQYADADGDGYGDAGVSEIECDDIPGYVVSSNDCDDADSVVHPGATESLDGIDQDCDGAPDDLSLDDADAILVGERSQDEAGWVVRGPGDLDGNGYADLLIGAPGEDSGGSQAGALYLVEGPVSGSVDLSLADARVMGAGTGDQAGYAVDAGTDFDDDGIGDIAVGAPGASGGGSSSGAAYVLLGLPSGSESLDDAWFTVNGESASDSAGSAVALPGDIDGDEVPDLLVGAWGEDSGGAQAGAAYLVLEVDEDELDLASAEKIIGEDAADYAGYALDGGEDVNGDGTPDILIGAYGEDSAGSGAGAVYLLYGPVSGPYDLALADVKLQGASSDDAAGKSVALTTDLEGDGASDLVVGAPGSDTAGTDAGAIYVVAGGALSSGGLGGAEAILTGAAAGDAAGVSARSAGDINADGFADLVVGGDLADGGGSGAGAAWLVLGPVSGVSGLADADANAAGGTTYDYAGHSVDAASDVNGDGHDDLLIGAYGQDDGGSSAGATYLLFGSGF